MTTHTGNRGQRVSPTIRRLRLAALLLQIVGGIGVVGVIAINVAQSFGRDGTYPFGLNAVTLLYVLGGGMILLVISIVAATTSRIMLRNDRAQRNLDAIANDTSLPEGVSHSPLADDNGGVPLADRD